MLDVLIFFSGFSFAASVVGTHTSYAWMQEGVKVDKKKISRPQSFKSVWANPKKDLQLLVLIVKVQERRPSGSQDAS
jgi:hypothetical protein